MYATIYWMDASSDQISASKKTYLPTTIHSPITDYATVNEFLKQMQRYSEQVNIPYVDITLDVGAAANTFQTV